MTKTPSDQTLEGLSALVDGETTAFESRRLLDMAGDPQLTEKWKRYHLAGALMRKEFSLSSSAIMPMTDLSSRISVAMDAEPAHGTIAAPVAKAVSQAAVAPRAAFAWRDWLAKSAIAASIAGAVVFGVQFTQNNGDSAYVATAEVQEPVVVAPVGFELPAPEARNVSLGRLAEPQRRLQPMEPSDQATYLNNAAVEAELQQLFLEHAELSAQNGKFGLMPMARAAKMKSAE
ncbi:MAG: sigma-E factor negative regulatory protein [Marinagarivorans sp.]|nr:sigma-E factor negative regulatory protein [Marinagarivorans sp.]